MVRDWAHWIPQRHLLPVAVLLAVGTTVSLVVSAGFRRSEERRFQEEFRRVSERRTDAIRRACGEVTFVLHAVRAFYGASQFVARDEFAVFTRPYLARVPGIRVLGWAPRVPLAERGECELRAREDGMERFEIADLSADKTRRAAAERPESFPAYYLAHVQSCAS